MVVRDTISSEALSYLEMALNILKAGYKGHTPLREMQKVLDESGKELETSGEQKRRK